MSDDSLTLTLKDRAELNKLVAIAEQTMNDMGPYEKNEFLEEVKADVERLKVSVEKLLHQKAKK